MNEIHLVRNYSSTARHELGRSLDEIAFALVVGLIVFFHMNAIAHFGYLRYLYLVPVILLALGARRLPIDVFPAAEEWRGICRRLRWTAVFSLTLSPFWTWWRQVNESYYFLFNTGLFFGSLGLYLYHLAMASRFIIRESGDRWMARIVYFIRMAVVYLTLGPVLAFLISAVVASFDCEANFVYQYVGAVAFWKKAVISSPALMLILLIWTLKLRGLGQVVESK